MHSKLLVVASPESVKGKHPFKCPEVTQGHFKYILLVKAS